MGSKLIKDKKIEPKTRGGRNPNNPLVIRAIEIAARVDEMISENPKITAREISERLNLSMDSVYSFLQDLRTYKVIEQLIAQEKTAQQIAAVMKIGTDQADFLITKLKRLRNLQRNLQNQSPSTG